MSLIPFEQQQDKTQQLTCAPNKDTDQTRLGRLAQSGANLTVNKRVACSSGGPATFFCWDLVMKKKFYNHSHPSADSRRAVVSYWQKNGH